MPLPRPSATHRAYVRFDEGYRVPATRADFLGPSVANRLASGQLRPRPPPPVSRPPGPGRR